MSGTGAAGDDYARALSDAEFLARIRAAYTGRAAVLDALWWLSRPLDTGPSGAPSPQLGVQELQRRVYSADADPSVIADESHRLRDAARAIEDDRRAIEFAVKAATAEVQKTASVVQDEASRSEPARMAEPPVHEGSGRYLGSGQVSGEPELIDDPQPQPEPEPEPAHRPAPTTRRRAVWVAIGAVLALVAGIVVGAQWPSWSQTVGATTDEPVSVVPSALPAAVQAHFDSIQDESIDTPQTSLPDFFDPASLRLLTTAEFSRDIDASSPSADHSQIFAARSTSGLTCLVAVPPESGYTSSCVVDTEFPSSGLSVYWVVRGSYPGSPSTLFNWSATWSAHGEIGTMGQTSSGENVEVVPAVAPDLGDVEIARFVYDRLNTSEPASAVVPAGTDGFTITGACGAGRSGTTVQYEVSSGVGTDLPLFSGKFDCNQGPDTNLMVSPGYDGMVVRLALIGDLNSVTSAYVVLSRYVE